MFPLGTSTKDSIVGILSVSWPLSAIKIWNALSKQSHNISYKATYKALQELTEEKIVEKTNNEYKLNEQWLKTTANTALEILKVYNTKYGEKQLTVNITTYKFSDEFYRLLTLMLLNSDEIRLASKTPALFIKKESTGSYLRQEYTKTLWDKIKQGNKIHYLFSTDLASKMIKQTADKEAVEKLKTLKTYPNLQVRHAPLHAVVTMAITKNSAIIGLASPSHTDLVGFIKIDGPNLDEISALYDSIFANAKSVDDFIEQLQLT